MKLVKIVRFVSSLAVLSATVYLVCDFAFKFFGPLERGTWVYVLTQVVLQILLAVAIFSRKLLIYTGRREPVKKHCAPHVDELLHCSHR